MAVENTPEVHNVVACTLCSCYPWAVLGLPPTWYKSPEYRSRIVREPRAVLADFGLERTRGMEIRVWDSSSDMRYLVLPERPAGTEGLSEEELAALVTRDSMIGTGLPKSAVSGGSLARRRGPGGAAALQRRARLRGALGEPRLRGRGRARRNATPFEWERFRQELIAEIGAWEREHGETIPAGATTSAGSPRSSSSCSPTACSTPTRSRRGWPSSRSTTSTTTTTTHHH